jgi:hypothetical protein
MHTKSGRRGQRTQEKAEEWALNVQKMSVAGSAASFSFLHTKSGGGNQEQNMQLPSDLHSRQKDPAF